MQATRNRPQDRERKIFGVYIKSISTMKIVLPITEVGKNMKSNLEKIISKRTEGKCIAEGFIRPGSVSVIRYSSGVVNQQYVDFNTVFECMICHPVEGMLIECDVKTIGSTGTRRLLQRPKADSQVVVAPTESRSIPLPLSVDDDDAGSLIEDDEDEPVEVKEPPKKPAVVVRKPAKKVTKA